MNLQLQPKNYLATAVAIFVGLAAVYAILIFTANTLENSMAQTVMISLGSAVFGAGLTFFLIQVVWQGRRS